MRAARRRAGDAVHRRGQPRPGAVRPTRTCWTSRAQNNRHLAFGFGIHQCAGLSLARLEGRIAIGRFLARFPGYRLTATPDARRPGALSRLPARAVRPGLNWLDTGDKPWPRPPPAQRHGRSAHAELVRRVLSVLPERAQQPHLPAPALRRARRWRWPAWLMLVATGNSMWLLAGLAVRATASPGSATSASRRTSRPASSARSTASWATG